MPAIRVTAKKFITASQGMKLATRVGRDFTISDGSKGDAKRSQ
jgi:hypothetical protein